VNVEDGSTGDDRSPGRGSENAGRRSTGIEALRVAEARALVLERSLNEMRGEMERMATAAAGSGRKAVHSTAIDRMPGQTPGSRRAVPSLELDKALRELRHAMARLYRGQGSERKADLDVVKTAVETTKTHIRELIDTNDQIDHELNLAQNLIDQLRDEPSLVHSKINHYLRPADRVSGDFILGAIGEQGSRYYLLGDFTGHGFAAALAIMAVHTTFTDLAAHGARVQDIAATLNEQLRRLLPTNRFLAAVFIEIFRPGELVTVCNAGMPDVLLRKGGQVATVIPSASVPLGIVPSAELRLDPVRFDLCAYDGLLTYSDGMIEASDANGDAFGPERVKRAFELSRSDPAEEVARCLEKHLHPRTPTDDVSALSIRLGRQGWDAVRR